MAMPVVDTEYLKEIDEARRDLRALISSKNCAPIMLRLAWHDAGTYDVNTKTGGPNGSIRNEEEHTHGSNNGLKIAIDFCEDIKVKHPKITYADLYQVLLVLLQLRSLGVQPLTLFLVERIQRFLQRKDDFQMLLKVFKFYSDISAGVLDCSVIYYRNTREVFKLRVPHLRDIFHRMGLSDKDIVALSGGHTLGRAHPERSGFDGPWTKEPLKELLKGESEGLLKLPTDKALLEDPEFHRYVELYAKDEDAFFRDYAVSHKKLSELGFTPGSSGSGAVVKDGTVLAQSAVGVAVAVAVVVLTYLYEVRKKMK
ncbi:unnamed protein product [Camellia sinensis]